ncbi:hypothetical protein BD779DRAFT_1682619 [Infundibulicybe gibba]|nr:hypothetical protein BD779DRAFT_1682619 [Infundibulicybe gibba]
MHRFHLLNSQGPRNNERRTAVELSSDMENLDLDDEEIAIRTELERINKHEPYKRLPYQYPPLKEFDHRPPLFMHGLALEFGEINEYVLRPDTPILPEMVHGDGIDLPFRRRTHGQMSCRRTVNIWITANGPIQHLPTIPHPPLSIRTHAPTRVIPTFTRVPALAFLPLLAYLLSPICVFACPPSPVPPFASKPFVHPNNHFRPPSRHLAPRNT